ncbi:MAG: response regulator transcription factor [Mycoplasmatales bacterium]
MDYKILIVEDDDLLRLGIKSMLEQKYKVVEATDAHKAIEQLEEHNFHLIITDIMMPGGNGDILLKYLKDNNLFIDTYVLSAVGEEKFIIDAYKLNIIDYIVKPVNFEILDKKVVNLFKSKYKFTDEDIILDKKEYIVQIKNRRYELTEKEFEIVQLLTSFPKTVFSKYDLLNEVWYGNMKMSEKIVEVTISNLRTKLDEDKDLIKTKRGQGYYYEAQENRK